VTRKAAQTWIVILACLTGGGLWSAPREVHEMIRGVVRDALIPGQRGIVLLADVGSSAGTRSLKLITPRGGSAETDALQRKVEQSERELIRLQLEGAELRRQLHEQGLSAAAGLPAISAPPLYEAELLSVRILGEETSPLWRARPLLGSGTASGLHEASLVLDDPRPLVDVGEDARLEPDQPVFAGGAVVGKIVRVGRYSSTLCPITDAEFVGAARLVRRSGEHVQYGAAGTLKGDGSDTCHLIRIPAAEPVAVGDLVVTVDTDGLLPPQVYGEVIQADPPEGTLDWQIKVRPATRPGTTVQVLRLRLNPERIARQ
jgi:hypothetical protein